MPVRNRVHNRSLLSFSAPSPTYMSNFFVSNCIASPESVDGHMYNSVHLPSLLLPKL